MTPEAYCYAKRAKGTQCDAPEPGSCRECELIAEVGNVFGLDTELVTPEGDIPLTEILTPPTRACNICQREAIHGLAFKGNPLCASCAPYPNAGEVMLEFTQTEEEALDAGGALGGEYLESIGLGEMFERVTPEQWREFLCRILGGYSEHMRESVKKHPPF